MDPRYRHLDIFRDGTKTRVFKVLSSIGFLNQKRAPDYLSATVTPLSEHSRDDRSDAITANIDLARDDRKQRFNWSFLIMAAYRVRKGLGLIMPFGD